MLSLAVECVLEWYEGLTAIVDLRTPVAEMGPAVILSIFLYEIS